MDRLYALVTWRLTRCGLILDLSVCVGDLEMDRMLTYSWP